MHVPAASRSGSRRALTILARSVGNACRARTARVCSNNCCSRLSIGASVLALLRSRLGAVPRSWLLCSWVLRNGKQVVMPSHGRNCVHTTVHDVRWNALQRAGSSMPSRARKYILRWQLVVLTMARQDAQRRPRSIGFWIKNILGTKRLAAQACGNARAAPISTYYVTKASTRIMGTLQRWSRIGSRIRIARP